MIKVLIFLQFRKCALLSDLFILVLICRGSVRLSPTDGSSPMTASAEEKNRFCETYSAGRSRRRPPLERQR